MPRCDCGFDAKSNAGLAAHRRARHPVPASGIEAAVRRDLAGVSGSEGLQAAAIALGAKLDETTSARDFPALAAELRQTLSDLGVAVKEEATSDVVDQLASRRDARIAATKDSVLPAAGK